MRSYPGGSVSRSARSSTSLPILHVLILLLLSGCLLMTSLFVLLLAINIPSLETNANTKSSNQGHGNIPSSESAETLAIDEQQSQEEETVEVMRHDNNNSNHHEHSTTRKPNYMHRFPLYGTPEFQKLCSWTFRDGGSKTTPAQSEPDCYILSRPSPTTNEGISEWLADVAAGAIYSIQLGCLHILDYGPGIDMNSVLSYADNGENIYNNWTVPNDILAGGCVKRNNCFRTTASWSSKSIPNVRKDIAKIKAQSGEHMPPKTVAIPNYRWAYHDTYRDKILADYTAMLEAGTTSTDDSNLRGFNFETGYACALGSTFKLSPSAAHYVPNLYTDILPALRDDSALVIALYIRTGRTDKLLHEKVGDPSVDKTQLVGYRRIFSCALEMEKDQLAKGAFTRSVWFVATDSPNVGRSVLSLYDNGSVETAAETDGTGVFQRRVYTTASRGVHSKAQIGPKTADFAEAIIDSYLLGESDFVISLGSVTFSDVAALRTARPIYKISGNAGRCEAMELPSTEKKTISFPAYQW